MISCIKIIYPQGLIQKFDLNNPFNLENYCYLTNETAIEGYF